MANFESWTSCNGLKLKKGARQYLDQFAFRGEDANVGIDRCGGLEFYGDWFSIYRCQNNGDDDFSNAEEVADDFYDGLRAFVPKGKVLEIHHIGHEKCRHPLSAQAVLISSDEVQYWDMP